MDRPVIVGRNRTKDNQSTGKNGVICECGPVLPTVGRLGKIQSSSALKKTTLPLYKKHY